MNRNERKIWFAATRPGWGWGLPITWQGWAVLVAYLVLVAAGVVGLKAGIGLVVFLLYVFSISSALLAVCWLKGEEPGWR